MMNRGLLTTLVSTFLFLVYGCSSIKVNTEYDLEHDFSALRTYTWYAGPYSKLDPLESDTVARNRFINAVNTVLEKKGFQLIQEEKADFVVAIRGDINSRTSGSRSGGRGYRYRSMSGSAISTNYQRKGVLTIDIVDPDTNMVIWRGSGTKTLSQTTNSEKKDAKSLRAVKHILKNFPPQKTWTT